jgi:hypothetical protein
MSSSCIVLVILAAAYSTARVEAFGRSHGSRYPTSDRRFRVDTSPLSTGHHGEPRFRERARGQLSTAVWSKDQEDDVGVERGFDAQGLGGYLAPYALALLISVLATAVAFKFLFLY